MNHQESLEYLAKLSGMLEFFVSRHSGEVATTKLIKLAYLADLKAVKELGRPISGVQYVSFDHGPWSRDFHDVLRGNRRLRAKRGWSPFGAPAVYYEYVGESPPNLRMLNGREIDILRQVDDRWGLVSLRKILEEIYSREPFRSTKFGERINLSGVRREPDFP